jgi:hypothetical protein
MVSTSGCLSRSENGRESRYESDGYSVRSRQNFTILLSSPAPPPPPVEVPGHDRKIDYSPRETIVINGHVQYYKYYTRTCSRRTYVIIVITFDDGCAVNSTRAWHT